MRGTGAVLGLKKVYLPPVEYGGEDLDGSWWGERLFMPAPGAARNEMRMGIIRNLR
jgi:hypothetical protein